MGLAHELREAVDTLSITDHAELLQLLPEHVTTAVHTGWFSEETMQDAFVIILSEAGATSEEDLDEINEAIDEFVEEELLEFDWKGIVKDAAKSVGKELAKQAAGAAAKKVKGIKTKTKTGKMLKHAAAGAIKKIGKDPKKAKEILKKSAAKAGKKVLKHAAKKGMKMVFGKWVKTEAMEEFQAMSEPEEHHEEPEEKSVVSEYLDIINNR